MKKIIFLIFFFGLWIINVHANLVNFDNPKVWDIISLVTNPPYTYIQGYNSYYTASGGFSYITNTAYIGDFCKLKGMTFVSFSNPILKSSFQSTNWVYYFTANPWLTWNINDTYVIWRITCDDGLTWDGVDMSNYYNTWTIDSLITNLSNQITNWTWSMNTTNYVINEEWITKELFTQEFLIEFYKWQLVIIILILCIKYFEIFSFWKKFKFFK